MQQLSLFKNGKTLKVPGKLPELRFLNNLRVCLPPVVYHFCNSGQAGKRREVTDMELNEILRLQNEKFEVRQISGQMRLRREFEGQFELEKVGEEERTMKRDFVSLMRRVHVNEREVKEYVYEAIFLDYGKQIEQHKYGWYSQKMKLIRSMTSQQQLQSARSQLKNYKNLSYLWLDYVFQILKLIKAIMIDPDLIVRKTLNPLLTLKTHFDTILALIIATEQVPFLNKLTQLDLAD